MPLKASNAINVVATPRLVRRAVHATKSEGGENKGKDSFRVVVMGSGGVGKSTIIQRVLETTGQKTTQKPLKKPDSKEELHRLVFTTTNGDSTSVELLDTSGYQSFPVMRELAIQQAQAFILVCSLDDESSFEYVRELRQEVLRVKQMQNPDRQPPIVVVVNKSDLPKDRCKFDLAYAELSVTCDWETCGFVVCSAENNTNIPRISSELINQLKAAMRRSCQEERAPSDANSSRRVSMPNFLQVPTGHVKRTPSIPRKFKLATNKTEEKVPGCAVQ